MNYNVIYQPNTLGDILFLQKFANVLVNTTQSKVYWPVTKNMESVIPYLENNFIQYKMPTENFHSEAFLNTFTGYLCDVVKNINQNKTSKFSMFPTVTTTVDTHNYNIYPLGMTYVASLQYQQHLKYVLYDDNVHCNYDNWQEHLFHNLKRNLKKENELFEIVTKGKNKDYKFISPFFSDSSIELSGYELDYKNKIKDQPGYCIYNQAKLDCCRKSKDVVVMENIPGYTLFDWGKVIEESSTITVVESAICYYMEILRVSNIPKTIYSRWKNKTYGYGLVNGLFKNEYVKIWKGSTT